MATSSASYFFATIQREKGESMLLLSLPLEMLVCIASYLGWEDVERFASASMVLHKNEPFFACLAVEWWGASFWRRALTRKTRSSFLGMRRELRRIHTFQMGLLAMGCETWGEREFRSYWNAEEKRLSSSSHFEPPHFGTRRRETASAKAASLR